MGKRPFRGLNHNQYQANFLEELKNVVRYAVCGSIYYQSPEKSGLIDIEYRYLNKDEALKLKFKEENFNKIEEDRERLNFESQSERDLMEQKINNILNDNIGDNKFINTQYKIDCKNIPTDEYFKSLDIMNKIDEMN